MQPRERDTPEQTQNRLLRRVDWRFLLPDPRPSRVAAVASEPLRSALETVFGPLSALSPGVDAGLAVAEDPDAGTLARLAAALREGGVCWVEWSSPLRGGPSAARRELEAAGFRDVRCFWRWPSAERCRLWLPLEEPGALGYFDTWRRPADGAVDQLLDTARRAQARAAIGLGLVPVCAMARKPMNAGPSDDSPAEPWAICESRAAESGRGGGVRRSCLLVTGGPRSTSKVVALVVDEPSGRPALAVKLARVAESVPGMAREAAVLRKLQASAAGPVPGVPRVAFERSLHGLLAVGETLMSGQPLQNLLRRGNAGEWARKATEWQLRLATHSRAPTLAPAERIAVPALARFEASFGDVIDAEDLRLTRERLGTLGALPVVCEHRDFSPWNVFVTSEGELTVLDWESAEAEGLPALDLIYFLTYMGFQVTGATRSGNLLESYREGLDASIAIGQVAQASLARYAEALGLDHSALHPLRLLTWLLHSKSEHERLLADHGGSPPATALRRSLFVRLWQEELRWRRA